MTTHRPAAAAGISKPAAEAAAIRGRLPAWMRRWLPASLRRAGAAALWMRNDGRDFAIECGGRVPFHAPRLWLLRRLGLRVGRGTSIHRGFRSYYPQGVVIGDRTTVGRDVLLDGRMGVTIGEDVSISEGAMLLTLEHDPNSPWFEARGAPIQVGRRVFIGTRAMVMPGIRLGDGAVVGAGAVVTRDVPPYTIVGGVPARPIGERSRDLRYTLSYRKFLG